MSGGLHAGIFGPTYCGKTTWAQCLAKSYTKRGISCLVLDPYSAEWPGAKHVTRHMGDFLAIAKNSRSCALFVDEAGRLDLRDPEHEWLLTGARHWGHVVHIIGQSGVQLSPLGRASITRLFLFRSNAETADYWRTTFVDDKILEATTLERFEFIAAEMFGDVRRMRVPPP